jgi:transposase
MAGRRIGASWPRRIRPVSRTCSDARAISASRTRTPGCRVQDTLQRALALRDRRARLSDHGVAVVRGRLVAEFLRILDHPGRAPALQRFARHLRTETPAIMSFLFDPSLDATNWRAEQALRPAVVNRKVSGGNRSARGAETQQILTSVVRTATQRQLRPSDVLVDLLRTPTPTGAPALQ